MKAKFIPIILTLWCVFFLSCIQKKDTPVYGPSVHDNSSDTLHIEKMDSSNLTDNQPKTDSSIREECVFDQETQTNDFLKGKL